jgi:microcystin-dependent protein
MALVPQNLGVPTGTIMWSAAPEVPVGWLLCDGRDVVRTDYPILFDFLGTEFGSTDPFTFTLPDLVGRFIRSTGEPGRDAFTYQDGMNGVHSHGMFPNETHYHTVTDPGHFHNLQGGDHSHVVTSFHLHASTSLHNHTSQPLPTHGYFPNLRNCNREAFVNPAGALGRECGQDPADVMVTQQQQLFPPPGWSGKTGITGVDSAFTGVTFNTSETGVLLNTAKTGLSAVPAATNIVIEETGAVGGAAPYNLALLPIIRT